MESLLEMYRTCSVVSRSFSFCWKMREDCFCYDDDALKILPRPMPHQGAAAFLQRAEFLQEAEREKFLRHFAFLVMHPFRRGSRTRPRQVVLGLLDIDGNVWYFRLTYQLEVQLDGGRAVYGTLQDISEFYRETAALRESLRHDAMTGLYAKTYVPQLINQIFNLWGMKGRRHALLVLDLDHFKQVNDRLGHLIGDAVILDLALALKMGFRKQDVLGHIGGDEFVVFMPNVTEKEVIERCGQFRASVRRKLGEPPDEVQLTGSIGIAFAPEHGSEYRTLFAKADAALYEAKKRGRDGQVIYDDAFGQQRRGMVKDKTRTADYKELTEKPLDYIFRMVLHSQDTGLSVHLLLEIFAKYFHVQRAYVFWNIDGVYWPRLLYEYRARPEDAGFAAHNPEIRRRMWRRYRTGDYGRFTECADVRMLPPQTKQLFEKAGICAWLECAFMEGSAFLGGVGFDDTSGTHEWNRAEHEVLAAFANIMHRFLLGQIYYERTKNAGSIYF